MAYSIRRTVGTGASTSKRHAAADKRDIGALTGWTKGQCPSTHRAAPIRECPLISTFAWLYSSRSSGCCANPSEPGDFDDMFLRIRDSCLCPLAAIGRSQYCAWAALQQCLPGVAVGRCSLAARALSSLPSALARTSHSPHRLVWAISQRHLRKCPVGSADGGRSGTTTTGHG